MTYPQLPQLPRAARLHHCLTGIGYDSTLGQGAWTTMGTAGQQGERNHPAYVAIPDPKKTEGLRAYREPAEPHPLQLAFLTEAGEHAWIEQVRALLVAGRFAEADALVSGALAGFDGKVARLAHALPPEAVTIDGWDDLVPILAEFEGPPVTAITIGLANAPDLVFEAGREIEPEILLGLYSDDEYDFTRASRAELLAECASDEPAWAGHEEDVEFYVVSLGLADLNTALIHHKHRYFLRDGRDGVSGRAPGGYVEYVLGCWLRAVRFLQALERAAADGGLPDGVRLIAGTVGLETDLATLVEPSARVALARAATTAPIPSLTIKPWVPREDPTADVPAPPLTLRQRIEQSEEAVPPAEAPPRRGFLARLFRRRG